MPRGVEATQHLDEMIEIGAVPVGAPEGSAGGEQGVGVGGPQGWHDGVSGCQGRSHA